MQPSYLKTKTKTSRLPAGERYEQIIDVATELFAQSGLHGITTRQVADEHA